MADKQIEKYLPKLRFPEFKNDGEWQVVRLGDVVRCFSGGTPSATNKDYYGGDIPFIRSGELHSSKTELYLTRAGLENSSAKMVEKGTILYALYGATSGDVGIARVSGAINQAILAIIPNVNIDKMYLYQYLSYSKDFIINRFLQGGQGNLSASIITSLSIPLPTIQEQKKIASCLSSLDECIALSKKKLEQLKAHKSGLMQKLFPAPGKTLLEYRFPEFKDEGEWKIMKVKDVCSIETGKSNTQDQVNDGKYPFFIRSENPVRSDKYLYDCEAVITIGDGKIGQVYHYINGKFDLHQRCYKMSDFKGVDGKYFYYYFSSHFYERAMRMSAKATVDSVRLEMIADMPIAVPCIKEQRAIASLFSSLDECITASKEKLDQLKAYKRGLMQQMFPLLY